MRIAFGLLVLCWICWSRGGNGGFLWELNFINQRFRHLGPCEVWLWMSGHWTRKNLKTEAHCHAESVTKKYAQESISHTGFDVSLRRRRLAPRYRDGIIDRHVKLKKEPEIGGEEREINALNAHMWTSPPLHAALYGRRMVVFRIYRNPCLCNIFS